MASKKPTDAELLALAEKATPRPWKDAVTADQCGHRIVLSIGTAHGYTPRELPDADACYIVAACNALPDLIARAQRAEKRVEQLRTAIKSVLKSPAHMGAVDIGALLDALEITQTFDAKGADDDGKS